MSRVLRLPANTRGRDFVVGDIHGAYDLVIEGMRAVRFDRSCDRLFSVGDLVDRGAGSIRCLGFLAQPYVFAVRGNHDDDLTTIDHRTARAIGSINFNGTGWLADLPEEKFLEIQRALDALPIVIEVITQRGTVGIVHGDVPPGMHWQEFTERIEAGDPKVMETALTGRDRIQRREQSGVDGIGRVFVGHTVQWSGMTCLGNVYAVDTGAVFREVSDRGVLSMINLASRTESLTSVLPVGQARVMTVDDAVGHPFGQYTRPRGG